MSVGSDEAPGAPACPAGAITASRPNTRRDDALSFRPRGRNDRALGMCAPEGEEQDRAVSDDAAAAAPERFQEKWRPVFRLENAQEQRPKASPMNQSSWEML